MTIKLYNTLSRKKEIIRPQKEDLITMYVCGPTVYSHPHIGNARAAIVPDILFRFLQTKYSQVIYIRNITDVDDKIIEAAEKENTSIDKITNKYTEIYKNNMSGLGILDPTYEPKVTEKIPNIINSIEKIIKNGNAYVSESHVLFNTKSYDSYGQLSRKKLDEMIDGARVDVASYKKYPGDFILWKPSIGDSPGWKSPWGKGRPGWHIECTSMVKDVLGDDTTLDIHGGGNDLIFPHHENEIAQGNCMSKKNYCNHWFHNGIVLVDKKKMSKSLGNVILVNDLLKKSNKNILRAALLSTHYRQPLNWTKKTLSNASGLIQRLSSSMEHEKQETLDITALDEISDILSDDLNTPEAFRYLTGLAKHAKRNKNDRYALMQSSMLLGIDLNHTTEEPDITDELRDKIETLLTKRSKLRNSGQYDEADIVRQELSDLGVSIEDSSGKTTWKIDADK